MLENQISKSKQIYLFRRHVPFKVREILLAVVMFSGNCFANDLRTTKNIPRSAKQVYFHNKNLQNILIPFLSSTFLYLWVL